VDDLYDRIACLNQSHWIVSVISGVHECFPCKYVLRAGMVADSRKFRLYCEWTVDVRVITMHRLAGRNGDDTWGIGFWSMPVLAISLVSRRA
jgi:hypothetical protein